MGKGKLLYTNLIIPITYSMDKLKEIMALSKPKAKVVLNKDLIQQQKDNFAKEQEEAKRIKQEEEERRLKEVE